MAARASPVQSTSGRMASRIEMDRPSTVKATISPSPDSPEVNRSTSRLNGARMSPIRMPATRTARNPEPNSSVAAA